MSIKVGGIKTGLLAAVLTFSATGCKKAPVYKSLSQEYVAPKVLSSLDSIRISGLKILSNSEYKLLGRDTVKINKDFAINPKKFMTEQNKVLEEKYADKVKTGSHADVWSDPDGAGVIVVNEYDPKYIDKVAVIKSDKLFTTDYTDTFVPIEHYGKVNPKVVPFLNENHVNLWERLKGLCSK